MIRPRIAFVTIYDATNRAQWSGIPYYLSQAIRAHWGEVTFIGPLADRAWPRLRQSWSFRLAARGWGRVLLAENHPAITRHYAEQVAERIKSQAFDLIFSPSTLPIADLHSTLPVVTYCDSTFSVMHGYYPEYSNLCEASIRHGHTVEQKAAQRATLLIYSSAWAAQSMVNDYGAPADRVVVVPFGSNLDVVPPRHDTEQRARRDRVRLLWLGRAWQRKGGDVAVAVLRELQQLGVPAALTICGTVPQGALPPDINVIPSVDKSTAAGRQQFGQLMRDHDWLILPTRADCTPLAVGEVNAYGLPALTSDVGGLRSVVQDGVNGYALPSASTPRAYAEVIARLWHAPEDYRCLARTARERFEAVLNWDAAVTAMMTAYDRVQGLS